MRIPRLAALLSGGLLVAGLSVGLSGTAHASDPVVPAGPWNEITVPFDNVAGNHLCVDVTNGSTSAGVALQLYSCKGYSSGGGPQRWVFAPVTNNHMLRWFIINVDNHLCIGSQGGSASNGVRLVQESCSAAQQFWQILPQNDNGTDPLLQLELWNGDTATGLCMAAGNMGDNNHTPLVATACQPLLPTPADLSQVLELG